MTTTQADIPAVQQAIRQLTRDQGRSWRNGFSILRTSGRGLRPQRPLNVTIYRRSDDWKPTILTEPDAVLELRAVEVNMTLADIYGGTR
jgi:hypothetical protein